MIDGLTLSGLVTNIQSDTGDTTSYRVQLSENKNYITIPNSVAVRYVRIGIGFQIPSTTGPSSGSPFYFQIKIGDNELFEFYAYSGSDPNLDPQKGFVWGTGVGTAVIQANFYNARSFFLKSRLSNKFIFLYNANYIWIVPKVPTRESMLTVITKPSAVASQSQSWNDTVFGAYPRNPRYEFEFYSLEEWKYNDTAVDDTVSLLPDFRFTKNYGFEDLTFNLNTVATNMQRGEFKVGYQVGYQYFDPKNYIMGKYLITAVTDDAYQRMFMTNSILFINGAKQYSLVRDIGGLNWQLPNPQCDASQQMIIPYIQYIFMRIRTNATVQTYSVIAYHDSGSTTILSGTESANTPIIGGAFSFSPAQCKQYNRMGIRFGISNIPYKNFVVYQGDDYSLFQAFYFLSDYGTFETIVIGKGKTVEINKSATQTDGEVLSLVQQEIRDGYVNGREYAIDREPVYTTIGFPVSELGKEFLVQFLNSPIVYDKNQVRVNILSVVFENNDNMTYIPTIQWKEVKYV